MTPRISRAAIVLLVLAGTYADRSSAALAGRSKLSTAAGLCQAALPTFEGLIRKRPLAVQNEGEANAFVTCAYTSDTQSSGNPGTSSFVASFINNSPAQMTVTCTAVVGFSSGSATYITKESPIILPGGVATSSIAWTSADNGGVAYAPNLPVNLSCNLPPGAGIATLTITHAVDIGD